MRCPRCGNENPGTNRFCGMCGNTLLPAPAVPTAQQAASEAPAAVSSRPGGAPPASHSRIANEPRPAAAAPERDAAISGPSFLGLNQPAPTSSSQRTTLGLDSHSTPSSRNLNYLLEDDEPKSGGAWKYVLILLALLLAIGLGYLRWKDQGLAWLTQSARKPSAATDSADSSQPNSPTSTSATNPNPAAPSPNPDQTAGNSSASAPSPSNPSPSNPAAARPAEPSNTASGATGSSANQASGNQASGTQPGDQGSSSGQASTATPTSEATQPTATAEAADTSSDSPPPIPAAKPKPSPKPSKPADPVTEAQRYLYGKGVKQDCERGLRLLKPEAEKANSKAMTEMGALYSAGLCTPRDLPTSYRWFAMALRRDPENQALKGDLQKLWDEMTQPERQQAIRLTQ